MLLHILFLTDAAEAEIVLWDTEGRLTLAVGIHCGVLRLDSVVSLESCEELDFDLALDVTPFASHGLKPFGDIVGEGDESQAEILANVQIRGGERGGRPPVLMGII